MLFIYDPRTYVNLTKDPDITLGTKAHQNICKNWKIIMYLDANQNMPHSSWACSHASNRLILPKHRCCTLRVKITFLKDAFLYSNLGQECCTTLPSVLQWEPGPRYLNDGLPTGSQMKSHSPLLAHFWAHPGMPQNCHSCTSNQDTLISVADLCQHWQGSAVLTVRYSYLFR